MQIQDLLLSPGSKHSRPGNAMTPQGIVVHYVGNPGSSALGNRNWFENNGGVASAHYVVGLNGEIIRCIPDNEVAWHAGKSFGSAWDAMARTNNSRLIGIETCHPLADGKFNDVTINALAELVADLCKRYKLNPDKDVYRHYDVCGKSCPLYYVNNPAAWAAVKAKIKEKYNLITGSAPAAAPEANAPAGDKPSSWAAESWQWARQNGILDGSRPGALATREECAAFMYNLYKLLQKH